MNELLTRKTIQLRANEAKAYVERHKRTENLEVELKLLETVDKIGTRQNRLCNILDVVPEVEDPLIQRTFEKVVK